MEKLKTLFEDINQIAFNLKSNKEIYTKQLNEEEQNSLEIEYLSGFQLLDNNIRITILEGNNKNVMPKVKESIKKECLNTEYSTLLINNYEKLNIIYSNKNLLYDCRMYSKFGLSLKFIKLRLPLNYILTNYDIYSKGDSSNNILNTFMNIASILRGPTLEIIDRLNLFPNSDSLLILERHYSDVLNNEDITGIKSNIKKLKKINVDHLNITNNTLNNTRRISNLNMSNKLLSNFSTLKNVNITKKSLNTIKENKISNKNLSNDSINKIVPNDITSKVKKPLNSFNTDFTNLKKQRCNNKTNFNIKNKEYIEKVRKLAKETKNYSNFCTREVNNEYLQKVEDKNVYLYANQRNNYWVKYMDKLRENLETSKDNCFYTYSNKYLYLSIPMQKNIANEAYNNYILNKSKWIGNKDFERYKLSSKSDKYI